MGLASVLCSESYEDYPAFSLLGDDHPCLFCQMFLSDQPSAFKNILSAISDDCLILFVVLSWNDLEGRTEPVEHESLGWHPIGQWMAIVNSDFDCRTRTEKLLRAQFLKSVADV